jgi:hypothetical protein
MEGYRKADKTIMRLHSNHTQRRLGRAAMIQPGRRGLYVQRERTSSARGCGRLLLRAAQYVSEFPSGASFLGYRRCSPRLHPTFSA